MVSFGSGSALVLGFVFTPLLSRIYGPEVYGQFSLLNSIVMNLAPVSTLAFEQAMILPKNRTAYYNLIGLNVRLLTLFVTIVLLGSIAASTELISLGPFSSVKGFFLFIPFFLLVNVLIQFLTNISVKRNEHAIVASAKIGNVLLTKGSAALYGSVINVGVLGFLFGELLGKILFVTTCFSNSKIRRDIVFGIARTKTRGVKEAFFEFKNYPKFVFPAIWITSFTNQLPVYFFSFFFDSNVVGLFAMSSSLLMIPISVLGRSVGMIFYQKAAETFNAGEFLHLRKISTALMSKLLLIGIPFVVLTVLFGEDLLVFVLGAKWIAASNYLKVMVIYFSFEIVSFPMISLYKVLRQEKNLLKIQLISFSVIGTCLFLSSFQLDPIFSLILLTFGKVFEIGLKSIFIFLKLKSLEGIN